MNKLRTFILVVLCVFFLCGCSNDSEDDIVKFSGDIKNTIKINTTNTIKEEVGDVIIRSSLTEEEENNYNNVKDRLIERLEK